MVWLVWIFGIMFLEMKKCSLRFLGGSSCMIGNLGCIILLGL